MQPKAKLSTGDGDRGDFHNTDPIPMNASFPAGYSAVEGWRNVGENEFANFVGFNADRSKRTQSYTHPEAANRAAESGRWVL